MHRLVRLRAVAPRRLARREEGEERFRQSELHQPRHRQLLPVPQNEAALQRVGQVLLAVARQMDNGSRGQFVDHHLDSRPGLRLIVPVTVETQNRLGPYYACHYFDFLRGLVEIRDGPRDSGLRHKQDFGPRAGDGVQFSACVDEHLQSWGVRRNDVVCATLKFIVKLPLDVVRHAVL